MEIIIHLPSYQSPASSFSLKNPSFFFVCLFVLLAPLRLLCIRRGETGLRPRQQRLEQAEPVGDSLAGDGCSRCGLEIQVVGKK